MSVPIPQSIAKRGIVQVSDNLAPGEYLSVGRIFNRIFRTELEERLFNKESKECDAAAAGVNVPSRSE